MFGTLSVGGYKKQYPLRLFFNLFYYHLLIIILLIFNLYLIYLVYRYVLLYLFMCLYLRLLKQKSVVGGILLPIRPFIFLKDNNLGLCDVFWSSVGPLRCLCSRRAVAEKSVGAPTSPPQSDHARRIRRCNVTWRHTLRARSTTPHRIQHTNLYIESRRPRAFIEAVPLIRDDAPPSSS